MGKRTYNLTSGDIINIKRHRGDPWTHATVAGYYVRRADIEFLGDKIKASIPVFEDVYDPPEDCDDSRHRDYEDYWRTVQIGTRVVWRSKSSVKLLNLVEAVGTEVWEAEDLPNGGVAVSRVS